VTLFYLFFISTSPLFSLLGALIIVGVDGAKRRHIMSQTESSSSIPNLEEGLKWVGPSIIRFFFPSPFSFSETSFLFLDFGWLAFSTKLF